MVHFTFILGAVTAFILLSSSLVSHVTMGNNILIASSDEGGDSGGDEGDKEQNGEGGNGPEEDPSEMPPDVEQASAADQLGVPAVQQISPQEGGEQYVLCDNNEEYNPETGKCEVRTAPGSEGL